MGVMDLVRRRLSPTVLTPRSTTIGPSWEAWWQEITTDVHQGSPAKLFRSQPHLYTVTTFLARNVAQLGLHSFERVSETDRARDRDSTAARVLANPDGVMTTYELIFATVGDLMLYDRAYWFVGESSQTSTGWMIRRLPPSWVAVTDSTPFQATQYTVAMGGEAVTVGADQILAFTGYNPSAPIYGSSAVEALRGTLREQIEAALYRQQTWKRGGRVSAVLQRPTEAPDWSDQAREAFREDWYAKYTGRGEKAGGTPILEDGMTLQRVDFNAQEQQFVEAAKLSLQTVAAAFHVNPTMIGQNDGATYSNVREFRRMLYGDTLGPLLAQLEARLNTFLLPMLGVDPERFYLEFNIQEKLQGSFEEQASAMQSATGAPWMTRAEARARMNLPAIDGADDLVVPLNVLTGGQASPNDSGSQNDTGQDSPKRRELHTKARAGKPYVAKAEQLLGDFFKRQERIIRGALGRKDDADWWDADRWNDELAGDLYKFSLMVSKTVAASTLKQIGFSPDEYDSDRTLAWLDAVSKRSAKSINQTTYDRISAAIDDEDDDALDAVFEQQQTRSGLSAVSLVTTLSGFATHEAASQATGGKASKTWVTGPNPRPEHAAMDGETVSLDENFSNGLAWPGDAAGGADEIAGCNCDMSISY